MNSKFRNHTILATASSSMFLVWICYEESSTSKAISMCTTRCHCCPS